MTAQNAPIIPVLLKYSEAKRWEDAKAEWRLNHIEYATEPDEFKTCECGHYPIAELCFIENEVNNTSLVVGNCCINQVSEEFETVKRIFPALKRRHINPAVIDYAHKRKIINDWEKAFLTSVWRKKKFTHKQLVVFKNLRTKIFNITIKGDAKPSKPTSQSLPGWDA